MKKNFFKSSFFAFVFLFGLNSFAGSNLDAHQCRELRQNIQEGDLIFTAVDTFLYREVANVTQSWTTHVGIVIQEKGRLVIGESKVPLSRYSDVCEFVGRSAGNQFSIKRPLFELKPEDILRLRIEIRNRLNVLYHLGFDYDSPRQYCSKFVYDVYAEATLVQVGQIETVQQLYDKNPEANLEFFNVWFLGQIPWERRVVTPASQYLDPKFKTILEKIDHQ